MSDQQPIPQVVHSTQQAVALLEEEIQQLEEQRKAKKAQLRDCRNFLAKLNGTKRRRNATAQPKEG